MAAMMFQSTQSKTDETEIAPAKSDRADSAVDGIRPIRPGPWDPCRFQKYQISPEFRLKLLSVKPPPADPRIFEDTPPPILISKGPELLQIRLPEAEEPSSSSNYENSSAPSANIAEHHRLLTALVIGGALLGAIAGYVFSSL